MLELRTGINDLVMPSRREYCRMLDHLPDHLKAFAVEQRYEAYSPINQAVWRYVMRQNRHFLETHAHDVYIEGLAAAGIDVDEIPRIERMNACLSRFGWGAVNVDGFIPPSVFMEFQAHRVLPIAIDIRTLDHIAYTPAPDIVHESAGHAPILVDPTFARFVELITELGAKAISSKEDHDLYEAIRRLSIVKEDPYATAEQIQAAEADFRLKQAAVTEVSEASLISRLYWWTVEYGLIGDLEHPRIYGAGLLSSVGESKRCLTDRVKKLPFDLENCLDAYYDITSYQPQLFVCESFDQLIEAIERFAPRMASVTGGTSGLVKAVQSHKPVTVVYSSGLKVEGTVEGLRYDDRQEAAYLRANGPTTLVVDAEVLPGHGPETHAEGFGAPIGRLKGESRPIEAFGEEDLERHGVVVDREAVLTFESGLTVRGRVSYVRRHAGRIILIGFSECTVAFEGEMLFHPEWGTYDMAVGERIVSVYAGSGLYHQHSTGPAQRRTHLSPPLTAAVPGQSLQRLYASVRRLREHPPGDLLEAIRPILTALDVEARQDWLLRLELLELLEAHAPASPERLHVRSQLEALKAEPEKRELIENGLALLQPPVPSRQRSRHALIEE